MNRDLQQAVARRLYKPEERNSYTPQVLEGLPIALRVVRSDNHYQEIGSIECVIKVVEISPLPNEHYRILIELESAVEFGYLQVVGLMDERPIRERNNNLSVKSPWTILVGDSEDCRAYPGGVAIWIGLPTEVTFIEWNGIIDGTGIFPTEYDAKDAGKNWERGPAGRSYIPRRL